MQRTAAPLAILALLLLAACGQEKDPAPGEPSPAATPTATSSSAAPEAAPEAAPAFSATGVLEPLGPSIYMQGTHKLMDGTKVLCLCASKTVDLAAHEGRRVKVTGSATKTIEGDQTLVEVTTIEPVK